MAHLTSVVLIIAAASIGAGALRVLITIIRAVLKEEAAKPSPEGV